MNAFVKKDEYIPPIIQRDWHDIHSPEHVKLTNAFILTRNMMQFYRPPLTPIGKIPLVYSLFTRDDSKPMKQWTPYEVLEWFCEEASRRNFEYEKFNLTNFRHINGKELLNMNKRDFIEKDKDYGHILFQIVQSSKGRNKLLKEGEVSNDTSKQQFKTRKKSSEQKLHLTKKRNKRKKCGRVWEFLRDLLLQPEYCPSIICWENYEEGIFRFVQSDKVAELWGKIKNNPNMNFEKFSRAIRHNYAKNFLQSVNERLVYGFGSKATGWKIENPNTINESKTTDTQASGSKSISK